MRLITREQLKAKLDNGEDLKLVFVLGEWHFRAKHIPGSIQVDTPEKTEHLLDKNQEIVVYCSNLQCPASMYAYHTLLEQGYVNVCRYAGGLQDWEEAGYPLAGEMVDAG
jgi:rhodanese-related sulfurtransferase